MKVGVIGGGAAGFFAAITCASTYPDAEITIFEKSNKLLSKVKVSGGGRCNVTNATFTTSELVKNYPRGDKFLKKAFPKFTTSDTINWFEDKGVKLKTEPDNRVFPVTDSSQTIIDCLLNEARKLGIIIKKRTAVNSIIKRGEIFEIKNDSSLYEVNKVIIATGGSPKLIGFEWLVDFGQQIEPPVPSLFTFNMPNDQVTKLQGVVVDNVTAKVLGTKLASTGSLLITHWGMSGPAILKLSAWGARLLAEKEYNFDISVNWTGLPNENLVREEISSVLQKKKKVVNTKPFPMPLRMWEYILSKIDLDFNKRWLDLSKKEINRLVNTLFNDIYIVNGKTTFKEEFVTCGGIALSDIDVNTMESKVCSGMFFCGEVMNIDGITGGFNFQAAWTTGYIAGKNVCG